MLYIDSSSLLKTLWYEPESDVVREGIAAENRVIISALTELETEVQLRGQWLGGSITKSHYNQYRMALLSFHDMTPFEFRDLPGTVFRRALQDLQSGRKHHCRCLDRLHLAAMAELGLSRLMTNDAKQAVAARILGYEVIVPSIN